MGKKGFEEGHEKFGGRKLGTQNKSTEAVKELYLTIIDKLGGDFF